MSDRDQLREALAVVLHGSNVSTDAVLAVLDQQDWVSPAERGRIYRDGFDAGENRAAALREAARYEPTVALVDDLAGRPCFWREPHGCKAEGWPEAAWCIPCRARDAAGRVTEGGQ